VAFYSDSRLHWLVAGDGQEETAVKQRFPSTCRLVVEGHSFCQVPEPWCLGRLLILIDGLETSRNTFFIMPWGSENVLTCWSKLTACYVRKHVSERWDAETDTGSRICTWSLRTRSYVSSLLVPSLKAVYCILTAVYGSSREWQVRPASAVAVAWLLLRTKRNKRRKQTRVSTIEDRSFLAMHRHQSVKLCLQLYLMCMKNENRYWIITQNPSGSELEGNSPRMIRRIARLKDSEKRMNWRHLFFLGSHLHLPFFICFEGYYKHPKPSFESPSEQSRLQLAKEGCEK